MPERSSRQPERWMLWLPMAVFAPVVGVVRLVVQKPMRDVST